VKSVYYAFGSILLIGVVAALYFLYQNVSDPSVALQYEKPQPAESQTQKKNYGWLEGLSKTGVTHDQYPVEELDIEFVLSDLPKPKKIFKLTARGIDQYDYFCIKQIFAQNDIQYEFVKQKQNLVARMSEMGSQKLQRLKNSLNYYEIEYSFDIFYEKDY